MKRKQFIKSSAYGIGAMSLLPIVNACKEEAKTQNVEASATEQAIKLQDPKIVKNSEGLVLNVLGDNQNIKLTGEDTNGQYTLIEQNNEPGVGIPPHVHQNEDEVFQVLEGQVEMTIGETKTTLGAGDLIFCPRGVAHSWRVVGEEKTRAMLSIFPAGLEGMFKELASLPAGPPDMETVSAICLKYKLSFV